MTELRSARDLAGIRWCRDGHTLKPSGWKGYWKSKAHFDGPWWQAMDTTRLFVVVYCVRCGESIEICVKNTNPEPEERTST